MKQKAVPVKQPAEDVIRDSRRARRRYFSAEAKIRIVLDSLHGEESISGICRRERIASSMYYGWSKEFLEASKKRLAINTAQTALPDAVRKLRHEGMSLKEAIADLTLENRLLKNIWALMGRRRHETSPSEMLEIIRLVEDADRLTQQTLEILGIARSNFYRWYDRYQRDGPEAPEDLPSRSERVWNRIAGAVREQIIEWALDSLDPRRANWRFGLRMSGEGLETRFQRLAKASGYKGGTIVVSTGVDTISMMKDLNSIIDPRVWYSARNVIVRINNIERGLSSSGPEYAANIRSNAANDTKQLEELDAHATAQIKAVSL